jgi:hypothetical protein
MTSLFADDAFASAVSATSGLDANDRLPLDVRMFDISVDDGSYAKHDRTRTVRFAAACARIENKFGSMSSEVSAGHLSSAASGDGDHSMGRDIASTDSYENTATVPMATGREGLDLVFSTADSSEDDIASRDSLVSADIGSHVKHDPTRPARYAVVCSKLEDKFGSVFSVISEGLLSSAASGDDEHSTRRDVTSTNSREKSATAPVATGRDELDLLFGSTYSSEFDYLTGKTPVSAEFTNRDILPVDASRIPWRKICPVNPFGAKVFKWSNMHVKRVKSEWPRPPCENILARLAEIEASSFTPQEPEMGNPLVNITDILIPNDDTSDEGSLEPGCAAKARRQDSELIFNLKDAAASVFQASAEARKARRAAEAHRESLLLNSRQKLKTWWSQFVAKSVILSAVKNTNPTGAGDR